MSDFASDNGSDPHLVNTYVSDMAALFGHIEKPLDGQLKDADAPKYADAKQLLQLIKATVSSQKLAFEEHLKALGGSGDHGIKTALSAIVGVGGAVVGALRSTKVSKALRDDYTALGLSAISCTMLHATALGVGDEKTATLAKSALDDVAPLIIKISESMAAIVLLELADDGVTVMTGAAEQTKQQTGASWSSAS